MTKKEWYYLLLAVACLGIGIAVLAAMGLTVSDAVRLLLTRIAREKALPFEPLVPNDTTIAAMREARAGRTVKRFSGPNP